MLYTYHMRIDKDNIKIILILLVVCLSLGYAYINSDLNINGTAQVKHANWDIHWANIQVTNGSVTGSNVVTQPTISNGTTVNYSVILPIPGDYYEFTVDAVNGGQIDAMIDTIDSKLNGATITTLPAYLKYSVTYEDDIELEPNHQLLHNTTEKYKVRIEYNTDIELNQIPASNQTLSLQFTVTYRQATDAATEVDHSMIVYTANVYDYTESGNKVWIGQAIPNGITQYSNAVEAMAELLEISHYDSFPFYLKQKIKNGTVAESYVEFIVTPELASANSGITAGTYALRGTGATKTGNNYNNDSIYYDDNKSLLLTAFGNNHCRIFSTYVRCDVSHLGATVNSNGRVNVDTGNWFCTAAEDGSSYCEYGD